MRYLIPLLLLVAILTACADQQTAGTASGDPTRSAPRPTESTPPPTDDAATSEQPAGDSSLIPVEGEGDIGDGQGSPAPLAQAPDFGVSSETDSGSISPYTSCWSTPSGDGDSVGLCSDGVPQPDALTLTGADQLVVTYEEGELTASATAQEDAATPQDEPVEATELPVVQDNPGIWLIDISGLPAGDHVVMLAWYGDQGDAFTAFTLTVQR